MQKNYWGAIKKKIKKIRPLPDNLGSWFLEYNLILTQLDEIFKNNKNWGAIKKNQNHGAIKKNDNITRKKEP